MVLSEGVTVGWSVSRLCPQWKLLRLIRILVNWAME